VLYVLSTKVDLHVRCITEQAEISASAEATIFDSPHILEAFVTDSRTAIDALDFSTPAGGVVPF
jgi:hypothetical protein